MAQRIELLDEAVINQIAAGEVIVRPACIVRELLQNAVDAGAASITLEVWQEGEELTQIAVRDNGTGIAANVLEKAFHNHTTSKLRTFADIFEITTLGFRGEALAAIAAISHIKAVSSNDDSGAGTELVLMGARKEKLAAAAAPRGFAVTVSEFFFNTPVRKKFLKQIAAERAAIKEELLKQVLSTQNVEFQYSFYKDGRERSNLQVPALYTLKDKIFALFKRQDLRGSLLPVTGTEWGFTFTGYLTNQKCRVANRKHQFLILGGRVIESPIFYKTLDRVYAHILPSKQYPMAFINVHAPKGSVDVNVHPTKKEVRFSHAANFGKALYTVAYRTVLQQILSGQKQEFNANTHHQPNSAEPVVRRFDTHKVFTTRETQLPEALASLPLAPAPDAALVGNAPDAPNMPTEAAAPQAAAQVVQASDAELAAAANKQERPPHVQLRVLAQLEKCYIVFTLNNELYITDQHAAHERLNYDNLMKKLVLNHKPIDRLTLVVPLFYERSVSDVEKLNAKKQLLAELGLDIEVFSKTVISVNEVPSLFPEQRLEKLISELLDVVLEEAPLAKEDFYRELVARMACRMSVMAGDTLSLLEMEQLILTLYERNVLLTCPHGRPFVKKLTSEELARFFERTRHLSKRVAAKQQTAAAAPTET